MLWIENGKKTEKYQGSRTLSDLQDFVSKMCDVDQEDSEKEGGEEDAASNPVLVLTGPTFEHEVSTGFSFVKFFAPWYKHFFIFALCFNNLLCR
jgi:thioredoxin domain-containing protein 5